MATHEEQPVWECKSCGKTEEVTNGECESCGPVQTLPMNPKALQEADIKPEKEAPVEGDVSEIVEEQQK